MIAVPHGSGTFAVFIAVILITLHLTRKASFLCLLRKEDGMDIVVSYHPHQRFTLARLHVRSRFEDFHLLGTTFSTFSFPLRRHWELLAISGRSGGHAEPCCTDVDCVSVG